MKKVVLLGDSIRPVGYGPRVPELLGSDYEVYQPDENCRFVKYTPRRLPLGFRIAKELKAHWVLYLMILPAVVYTVIFNYLPLQGVLIAFERFNLRQGVFGSKWVWFDNFKVLISTGKLWSLTKNTIMYNLIFLVTSTVFNVALAIIISEMGTQKYKKTLQSAMLLPHFLSWVVVGGMVFNILNTDFGLLNKVLTFFGLEPINVYVNEGIWKVIYPIINIWKTAGYGSIFYMAAITGINPEIYEAADVDGCGVVQRIWYITIPSIRSTIAIMLLLNLGGILHGNMDMFWQITAQNPVLMNATDVIDTYVNRTLINLKDYGITAAASLYQSVIGCILVLVFNTITKRLDPDSAIF